MQGINFEPLSNNLIKLFKKSLFSLKFNSPNKKTLLLTLKISKGLSINILTGWYLFDENFSFGFDVHGYCDY